MSNLLDSLKYPPVKIFVVLTAILVLIHVLVMMVRGEAVLSMSYMSYAVCCAGLGALGLYGACSLNPVLGWFVFACLSICLCSSLMSLMPSSTPAPPAMPKVTPPPSPPVSSIPISSPIHP